MDRGGRRGRRGGGIGGVVVWTQPFLAVGWGGGGDGVGCLAFGVWFMEVGMNSEDVGRRGTGKGIDCLLASLCGCYLRYCRGVGFQICRLSLFLFCCRMQRDW